MEHMSLVIFTLFAQCAAGLFAITALIQLQVNPAKQTHQTKVLTPNYLMALSVLVIAMIASTTHLSQPLRAMNVLYGLKHGSALSLEIVALGLFAGIAGLFILLQMRTPAASSSRSLLLVLGIVSAFALVQAIAKVYTLPSIPAWDSNLTPITFFQSSLVMGSTLAAALFAIKTDRFGSLKDVAYKVIGWAGLLALILVVIVAALTLQHFMAVGVVRHLGEDHALVIYAYTVLVVAGLLCWMLPVLHRENLGFHPARGLGLIVVAEVMSRITFYDLLHMKVM